ncbi:hypothetical protein [Mycobacterium sp.]|uniref:hypothetical protein n=1 Tax=Mycobacterium sp. TaxID=1785 RepID=UPI0012761675|nr:hypothetical protein [Mycobacterium sp.]KAA8968929.1 MAG: hypothetical protein F6Q13_04220 [Mycobacterium sp.]
MIGSRPGVVGDGFRVLCLIVSAAGCAALLAVGVWPATAAPDTDDQGFIDSAARCTTPDVAVVFGSTESSRVAICKTPGGQYEYRGVRMRDGAKLAVPATPSERGFVAENDGIVYTLTPKSLVISTDGNVLRDEPMTYFHGSTASTAPAATSTPTTPLPPPLPAEVGGSGR